MDEILTFDYTLVCSLQIICFGFYSLWVLLPFVRMSSGTEKNISFDNKNVSILFHFFLACFKIDRR